MGKKRKSPAKAGEDFRTTLPDFLKNYKGPSGLENLSPDDAAWMGENKKEELSDEEEAIFKHVFGPEASLVQILRTIIESYPDKNGPTIDSRLDDAFHELLRITKESEGKRKRGRGERRFFLSVGNGAGDEIRTHDFNLGKVALYP